MSCWTNSQVTGELRGHDTHVMPLWWEIHSTRDTHKWMLTEYPLTFKRLGHLCQNVILFSQFVHYKCKSLVWNLSNTTDISSALWLLISWCFSTRTPVTTIASPKDFLNSPVFGHHWARRWPSTWWCLAISRHSVDCNVSHAFFQVSLAINDSISL